MQFLSLTRDIWVEISMLLPYFGLLLSMSPFGVKNSFVPFILRIMVVWLWDHIWLLWVHIHMVVFITDKCWVTYLNSEFVPGIDSSIWEKFFWRFRWHFSGTMHNFYFLLNGGIVLIVKKISFAESSHVVCCFLFSWSQVMVYRCFGCILVDWCKPLHLVFQLPYWCMLIVLHWSSKCQRLWWLCPMYVHELLPFQRG